MLLQVVPPSELTQTLASTHWGAILLLTVLVMGSWITYLAYMLRVLNKQISDDAKASKADLQTDRLRAETLLERSVTALNQASSTLKTVQDKVCDQGRKIDRLAEVSDSLRDKISLCPYHRGVIS